MKWQFLSMIVVVVAAMLMVWRGSSKKSGNCDCKGGCAHESHPEPEKEEAVR